MIEKQTNTRQTVDIDLAGRGYCIQIGPGLLNLSATYAQLPEASSAVIITNTTVDALYADGVHAALQQRYGFVHKIVLPDGEKHKTWASLDLIFSALLEKRCDRKTLLFALGGGVIGDMTGFAAACFMRGVRFVQLPTTLLAQVDSSVGGKTGINHPLGKNMIGAFHQPVLVVCDTDTLKTLPGRELSAGLAEVIKYGPIADENFLRRLEVDIEKIRQLQPIATAFAVQRSCQIKAAIVASDEKEEGLRAHLNFGHTFGHAIEAGMGYGRWLHGEAVAAGMVMAAHLSVRLGLLHPEKVKALTALIDRAGLPTMGPVLDSQDNAKRYLQLMRIDKKSQNGAIRFVVIHNDNSASLQTVPDEWVAQVIDACCQA
jgi:3-dehydroquinate synthase